MSASRRNNVSLWTVQILLALVFLFAGGAKLVMPLEALKGPIALPGLFLRFIGTAETLGAIGLILPGLLKLRRDLTPLAASGLVTIMTGATVLTAIGIGALPALIPFVVGMLAATVAYGRRSWVPRRLTIARRGLRQVTGIQAHG